MSSSQDVEEKSQRREADSEEHLKVSSHFHPHDNIKTNLSDRTGRDRNLSIPLPKKARLLSSERYQCVACHANFIRSEDLLEHLANQHFFSDPRITSIKELHEKSLNRKEHNRTCFTQECLMCDYSPVEDSNLAAKYRALQDHIITIHFKAPLPHLKQSREGVWHKPEGFESLDEKCSPESPNRCHLCLREFPDEDQLLNHLSLLCQASFQCDFCTFNFERVKSLAEHVKKYHQTEVATELKAKTEIKQEYAPLVYKNESPLNVEPMLSPKIGIKYTFRCQLCGKVFLSEELLRNHKSIFHKS